MATVFIVCAIICHFFNHFQMLMLHNLKKFILLYNFETLKKKIKPYCKKIHFIAKRLRLMNMYVQS